MWTEKKKKEEVWVIWGLMGTFFHPEEKHGRQKMILGKVIIDYYNRTLSNSARNDWAPVMNY